jgi:DNA-damage-inducible protein J
MNARTQQFNMKIDAELKQRADAVAEDLGLTTTDAMRVFLKKFVANRGFPFYVEITPRYNEETEQAIKDATAGIGLTPTSLEELNIMWNEARNETAA